MNNGLKLLGDGTIAQGVVILDDEGNLANIGPIFQQDLIGNAHNYYPDKTRGFVFGKKTGVNNVFIDLWEGPTPTYVFPTVGQQMLLKSDSVNDTAGGSGIQRMHLHYLDSNYQIKSTSVAMNGTVGTLTEPLDILRINGMHATAVGSGGAAAGNISLTNTAGTVTYAYLTAGVNSARQAIYTIPDGYVGYINHWQASSGSTGNHFCQTTLRATCHDGVLWPGVFLIQDEQGSQNNGQIIPMPIPIPIPPRSDVKISAISDAANANVTALGAIMGWFEPVQ